MCFFRRDETFFQSGEIVARDAGKFPSDANAGRCNGVCGFAYCLRGGKCCCLRLFEGNLFVTVRACKHFANFAGEISKTL